MNNEQGARLNKFLKIIGYIISSVIVWFYITKKLALLVVPGGGDDAILVSIPIGIFWPIIALIIANVCYRSYTWIATGKSKGFLDL